MASRKGIRVWLNAPESAGIGEAVLLVLHAENQSDTPVELYLRGRTPTYDFTLESSDGRVVWHRLADEIIPAIIRHTVLEPREKLEFRHRWRQQTDSGDRVEAGSYLVTGSLLTDAEPLVSAPQSLRITTKG